ncbi:sugar ABC transporter permease [Kosmotoga pacifica]|uniref:ABC transmembrane type-1 domain-containing protein n=1 Tax=Kosmotoga pacifica TaxID=1330330 RepID=A0A0G2ZE45_9BACT|nr:sugar ABC transporter permease [Kosmotoga pacifica]AKI97083.1 hypothetical protein IX53_03765 [Kosmotoga pacifica]
MAIEKKRYWLRHLVLIIIVAIVLFPMVWLISTSIRRDQAAFSPHLFSTRVTLQHYKNLLVPERSVPRLILDIQEAVYKLGRFRNKDEDSIKRTVEKYLTKFESLMLESRDITSKLTASFSKTEEALAGDIKTKMLASLNRLREEDLKLIDKKLTELSELIEDGQVKSVAALEILSSTAPSTGGKFLFFLNEVDGDEASKLSSLLSEYETERANALKYSDELSTRLKEMDFEMKDEVLESLTRTPEYLSENGVEYSLWRKNEYFKYIRKYISKLEKELSQELAEEIKTLREGLYNTFKAANATWNEIETLYKQLIDGLDQKKAEVLGRDYVEYLVSQEELANVDKDIVRNEKLLQQSLSARTELQETLALAIPVLVPESERVDSLKSAVEKALEAPYIERVEEKKSEDLLGFYERLRKVISDFERIGYKDDVYATLVNITTGLSWFVDKAGILAANVRNPEIKKILEVLNASQVNLMRVIPDIENVLSEATNLEEQIAIVQNDLDSLKRKKILLEQRVSELESSYNELLEKYNRNAEYLKLQYVRSVALKEIDGVDSARTYIAEAGKTVSEFFGFKYNIRYRDLTWYDDFEEARQNIVEGTQILDEAIDDLSSLEASLKKKVYDYIHLRFLGTPITLDEFTTMIDNYNKYFQVFNAKYQRASRKISDMLDYPSSYSGEYHSQLKEIDRLLFRNNQVWVQKESTYFYFTKWIMNSIIVALMVALISVTVAALAAYPFSRMRFFGRSQGLLFLLLIQMFPSIMFMIAIYALLQFMGSYLPFFGLNSLSGLIFVYSGGIAFNIWLIKGYFDTIPDTLEESAMIDGATRFQTFWRIVIPLARPILAVIAILTFMGIFNEFVMARILLQDINKWTYAVGLQQFSGRFETNWGPFTAAALIGAIPMVTFFLVLQDYIVGGLTKGAVKG